MHVHCARVAALVSGVPAVGFLQSPAAVYIASCFEAGAGSNSGGGGVFTCCRSVVQALLLQAIAAQQMPVT
jgi:hypothetical protein